MAVPRKLASPPITEALVDLRIAGTAEVTRDQLKRLGESIADRYPHLEEQRQIETSFEVGSKGLTTSTRQSGVLGVRCFSADRLSIVQLRPIGFTYNRLAPYSTAEDLFRHTFELWPLYVDLMKPAKVVRLALRYINKIVLPIHRGDDLGLFLEKPPEMPADVPVEVAGFLTRLNLVEPTTGTLAQVTQHLGPASSGRSPELIIDNDIFRNGQFETEAGVLEQMLQEMRVLKNLLFFKVLTDKALEPFE